MKQYNTIAQRIGAAFLDGVLFLLLSYIFTLIFNSSIDIYGFVLAAYHIICHAEFGQTLGKKLTNIKVVAVKNGDKLSYYQSTLRESLWIIAAIINLYADNNLHSNTNEDLCTTYIILTAYLFILLADIIVMLMNTRRRALYDYIAASVVVDISDYSKGVLPYSNKDY